MGSNPSGGGKKGAKKGGKEGLNDPVTSLGNLENTFGAIYHLITLNISDNNCLKYIFLICLKERSKNTFGAIYRNTFSLKYIFHLSESP